MDKKDIKVGQIWEVFSDAFYGSKDIQGHKRPAKFMLEKGEKIEIRYPFAWNYRTEDNMYLYSTPEYILENCKLIGEVEEKIRFNNKASLEEILRLKLFTIHTPPPTK